MIHIEVKLYISIVHFIKRKWTCTIHEALSTEERLIFSYLQMTPALEIMNINNLILFEAITM